MPRCSLRPECRRGRPSDRSRRRRRGGHGGHRGSRGAAREAGHHYETDKAWDAIHRCLTDGTLSGEGPAPLHLAVLGGRSLYVEEDYVVRYLTPAEVAEVARALAGLDRDWFLGRYQSLDPDDYDGPMGEDDFEYTWENFAGLRDFLRAAAEKGLAVIFTVDQ
ncbi:MAG: YfbM family protein [Isosphaeraceae bacterium]